MKFIEQSAVNILKFFCLLFADYFLTIFQLPAPYFL